MSCFQTNNVIYCSIPKIPRLKTKTWRFGPPCVLMYCTTVVLSHLIKTVLFWTRSIEIAHSLGFTRFRTCWKCPFWINVFWDTDWGVSNLWSVLNSHTFWEQGKGYCKNLLESGVMDFFYSFFSNKSLTKRLMKQGKLMSFSPWEIVVFE